MSNLLSGIASGAQPIYFSYIARSKRQLERAFGKFNALNLVGGALGSLATVLFSSLFPRPIRFTYSIVFALLAYTLSLLFVLTLENVRPRPRRLGKPSREVAGLIAFEGLLALGASAGIWNFDFYLTLKYKSGLKSIGMLHFFQLLLQALGSYLSPRLASRLGTALAYYSLTVPATLMVLLITLTNDFLLAYVLFILRTALMNAANPLL
ncbi:hypothetical protein IPA_06905 [Ignicoccus pacificus DSM 13166]|uniref:Uncharacterized protein n=1 Tax=Ignicoccus pacificus DSM 13166 TaxID=940294 RepID=A0A977KBJ6_9CREN|nr:hypothetical protein IPA_06905 [Ignicoccus pacificus DSM 13166]